MSAPQHGSAAGNDPADAFAGASGLHEPAHQPAASPEPPGLVDLAAVLIAGRQAGEPPTTRRTGGSPNPLLDAERARRINGDVTPSLNGEREASRSPHNTTPTRPFTRPVPEDGPSTGQAPASPNWRADLPRHGADTEELRFFMLREFALLQAEARAQQQ